jgi:hypothetical protein
MKQLLALALVMLPLAAFAEGHMDVIQVDLKDGCTPAQYAAIAHDFNRDWGKDHGYHTEVLVPLQSQDLTSVFWIGRTADATAFGAAWDAWRDALPNAGSTAAKLQARFDACSTNASRRSYDVY